MCDAWREQCLVCPKTGTGLTGEWPELRNAVGEPVLIDDLGIVRTSVPATQDIEFHDRMEKGANLRELQHVHLHLCYWETPYYKKAITDFLGDVSPDGKLAADIGCGDGRFTEHLLDLGYERVIAADVDIKPLRSLARYAQEQGFRDKLLLIECSADDVPVSPGSLDVVLTMGVLYYLNDRFEAALRHVAALLKPGGTMVDSEPDVEGATLKALVFDDLLDFVRVVEDHTFTEPVAGEKFRFRLFSRDEIQRHYGNVGLEVVGSHSLSILPSILRIGMVRGVYDQAQIAELEPRIRAAFDYYNDNGSMPKHIIWKTRRTDQFGRGSAQC